MNNQKFFRFIFFIAVLLLMVVPFRAESQDNVKYFEPITDISINIKELTMNVGEQYTLPLAYDPADTPNSFLKWYMDETTIQFDPETYTITALSAGKTRLMVESTGNLAWDYCDITVIGSEPKDAAGKKSGTELITLSEKYRSKIKAKTFLHFLDFIDNSSFTPEDFESWSGRNFHVTAIVEPGTVDDQSGLAASLGMKKALALPDFDAVSMYGTAAQILSFVGNNDSLIRLIEFAPMPIDDPVPEQENGTAPKAMNLKDNVEALTSISKAHSLGLKGDGTVIAVIDTGLNKDHEQFKGRVIAEYCASYSEEVFDDDDKLYSVCISGSSEPSRARNKDEYNHGSHAAGIAAGRDGIAPHANIVSISNASEYCDKTGCMRFIVFDIMEVGQYLINLQRMYKSTGQPQIVAVNMSFGGGKSTENCDEQYPDHKKVYDLLAENGIIPVNSSGNDGYIEAISRYGCISSVFAVGALADSPDPTIRSSSNHARMVDILAPGSKIWSALYVQDDHDETVCSGINCYGIKSGTSMAAPMVTGAFAILKQANPNQTVSQLESQIKSMSTKSANYRPASKKNPEITFSYDTPVLDFSEIEKYIVKPHQIPDSGWFDLSVLPRTGFSSVRPQSLNAMPEDLKYEPLEMTLEIPVLDISSEIVKVPVLDGDYEVTWLGDSVGLLEGSALPGSGTVILAGHNHLNNTESGPFALLGSLDTGDMILIRDSRNELRIFAVYANEKVPETDLGAVNRLAGVFDNSLILITCEDEKVSGGYANRRIVAAGPVR